MPRSVARLIRTCFRFIDDYDNIELRLFLLITLMYFSHWCKHYAMCHADESIAAADWWCVICKMPSHADNIMSRHFFRWGRIFVPMKYFHWLMCITFVMSADYVMADALHFSDDGFDYFISMRLLDDVIIVADYDAMLMMMITCQPLMCRL